MKSRMGIGRIAALAREALTTGKAVRELALEERPFTKKQLDTILSPQETTNPGIAGPGAMEQENEE